MNYVSSYNLLQSPVEVFKGPDGSQLFMRTSSGEEFGPFDQVKSKRPSV